MVDCVNLTITNQFIWYNATCKKGNIRDINLAKDLCERGQFTSTLETDSEAQMVEKRTNQNVTTLHHSSKKRVIISSTEDDSENDNAISRKSKKTFTRPIINVANTPLRTPSLFKGSPVRKHMNEMPEQTSSNSTASANSISSQPLLINKNDLEIVLSLKFELREMNTRLENIENLLRSRNSVSAAEDFGEHHFCDHLPARTVEELDALNAKINESKHFHELLNFLYLLGGESIQKTVYIIMGKVFHKELAVLYSGQGRKKKLDFSRMKLYDVVMEATRKRHKSATVEQMKKGIGLYLASAKARLKN